MRRRGRDDAPRRPQLRPRPSRRHRGGAAIPRRPGRRCTCFLIAHGRRSGCSRSVGRLHRAAAVRRHAGHGLHLAAVGRSTSTTSSTPGRRATCPSYFLNTLIVAVPAVIVTLLVASMVAFAVSRFSWRFNIAAADDLHGRQPAAAAGDHRPAVPDVPRRCRLPQPLSDNGILYDQYFGDRPDPHRVPAGLLHVRAVELHEDDLEGADRGGARRRRVVCGSAAA